MMPASEVRPIFAWSLVVAIFSGVGPHVFGSHWVVAVQMMSVSWFLTALWLALLITAFVHHKKQGMWLLIGAPFALFHAALVLMVAWQCARNAATCPSI
jgi:hypothetical protein